MSRIAESLQRAGLVPAAASLPPSAASASLSANLLPLVLQAWSAQPGPWRRDAAARREAALWRLTRLQEQGASLTYGVPGVAADRFERWLGPPVGVVAWRRSGRPVRRSREFSAGAGTGPPQGLVHRVAIGLYAGRSTAGCAAHRGPDHRRAIRAALRRVVRTAGVVPGSGTGVTAFLPSAGEPNCWPLPSRSRPARCGSAFRRS